MSTPSTEAAAPSAYLELERLFARLSSLDHAGALMFWDMQTQMPEAAAEARGDAMAGIAGLGHEMLTDPRVADWLAAAEEAWGDHDATRDDERSATHWRRANLAEMRAVHTHAVAAPTDLVEALERATTASDVAWRRARADDDFAAFQPHLEEVLRLSRALAAAKSEALGLSPYDAMLDAHQRGLTAATVDALFAPLEAFLPAFTDAVIEAQAREPAPLEPQGPFPIPAQRTAIDALTRRAGLQADRSRMDVSTHPFCCTIGGETRITTRYREDMFAPALLGALHETGHAVYEQNLPSAWRNQPVGDARGMAMHESQSLLIEMQVARSPAFLAVAAPVIAAAFGRAPGADPAFGADNLARLFTRVARSFIRVDADEVTYPAHVILRYRLETALLAGDLAPADLPGAWREAMTRHVGVAPDDDRQGCLQDTHWPGGLFGYFPSYTLGAMGAAQLFQAATASDAAIGDGVAKGDLAPLLAWLAQNVHGRGASASFDAIYRDATGAPLGADAFVAHLKARYAPT